MVGSGRSCLVHGGLAFVRTTSVLSIGCVRVPRGSRPESNFLSGRTPETRCSTHFFRNYPHEDIIEAQQKVFDADPDDRLLAIGADAAAV